MGRALADLRMRAVTSFYRRVILMVRDLEVVEDSPPDAAGRLAPLHPEDLDAYLRFRPRADLERLRARLAKGDEAAVAWVGGEIVHAAWMAAGRAYVAYLDRDMILAPEEFLSYDSYTLPAFRESGIAKVRMLHVFREYRRRGYRRCFGVVAAENAVGMRAVTAGGYRPAGRYTSVRLGPWNWCWSGPSGGAPVPVLARHNGTLS